MKKALTLWLTLALVLSILPATAQAAEGQDVAVYYEYMEYDQNTGEDFYDPDTGRITGKRCVARDRGRSAVCGRAAQRRGDADHQRYLSRGADGRFQ